ncbi:MAG: hypothetical protein HC853_08320 [Anaerolineae bacterium]|nr:hypothetical protein [Anaerolineae bacterium]
MSWSETFDRVNDVRRFIKLAYVSSPQVSVLDCAIVRFNTAYVALEITDSSSGQKQVSCDVWLLKHGNTLCYRSMSEESGPYAYHCPERILRQLTPTESCIANDWRKACWANVQKRQNAQRLIPGDVFELAAGIRFSNGLTLNCFRLKDPRRLVCQGWFEGAFTGSYRLKRDALRDSKMTLLSSGLPVPVTHRGQPSIDYKTVLDVAVGYGVVCGVSDDRHESTKPGHECYAALQASETHPSQPHGFYLVFGPTDQLMALSLSKRASNYVGAAFGIKLVPRAVQVKHGSLYSGSLNAVVPDWQRLQNRVEVAGDLTAMPPSGRGEAGGSVRTEIQPSLFDRSLSA